MHSYREDKDLSELIGLAGESVDNVRLVKLTEPFVYSKEKLMRHYFSTGNAFPIMVISRIEWLK